MESQDQFKFISEEEKERIAAMLAEPEGRQILAKRLEKIPEEVQLEEAVALYGKNPHPLFFAREIKLDEQSHEPIIGKDLWSKDEKETLPPSTGVDAHHIDPRKAASYSKKIISLWIT